MIHQRRNRPIVRVWRGLDMRIGLSPPFMGEGLFRIKNNRTIHRGMISFSSNTSRMWKRNGRRLSTKTLPIQAKDLWKKRKRRKIRSKNHLGLGKILNQTRMLYRAPRLLTSRKCLLHLPSPKQVAQQTVLCFWVLKDGNINHGTDRPSNL